MLFEDRQRAESFGAVAELYDRTRPSYPEALIDALLEDGPHRALDVGCGTGIVSRLLKRSSLDVLGVEVDPRMAEVARAKGTEVEISKFEDWQPAGRRFDLLVSGQAWHWVDPILGAKRAAEVLDVQGRLGVFWNFGEHDEELQALLDPIYERFGPQLDNHAVLFGNRDDRMEQTCEGIAKTDAFDEPEVLSFPWSTTYTTSQWLDQLVTHSDHISLPPQRRQALLSAVGEAIDSLGGSFENRYVAMLATAKRR